MKMSQIRTLNQMARDNPELLRDAEKVSQWLVKAGIRPDMLYQELEMDDRFVDTHMDAQSVPGIVQLHSHNFYEILYIVSGDLHYLIGTQRYRIRKGDVILIPPGVSHQPVMPEGGDGNYVRYVLWLSTEFTHQIGGLLPREQLTCPSLLRTDVARQDELRQRFQAGVREAEKRKPGWQAALYGNTLELMTLLYRTVADKKTQKLHSDEPELLSRILNYMERNLAEPMTLEQVSRHFYVSQSSVSKLFRRKMGVSFHRLLTQRRLIAAKELIANQVPLEAVSTQVGFGDYSVFYRAFRQEYGISPKQYRSLLARNGKPD